MPFLLDTLSHLLQNVLPAAAEYQAAEDALSKAHESGDWAAEGITAKRKAAELAVAIDGLADRASLESGIAIGQIRTSVSALCVWPGSTHVREEAFERVYGVADAYKHSKLNRPKHVIDSFE